MSKNAKHFPTTAELERVFNSTERAFGDTDINKPVASSRGRGSRGRGTRGGRGASTANYDNSKGVRGTSHTTQNIRGSGRNNRGRGGQHHGNKPFQMNQSFNLADDAEILELEYQSVKSRKQFESLWKVPAAKEALIFILAKTLRDSINRAAIINIIQRNIGKPGADELIYKALNAEYMKANRPDDTESIAEYRINARIRDLNNILTDNMKRADAYLDFGGGDGTISEGIAKWLGVKKENAISADVAVWLSGTQTQKQLSGITFNTIPKSGRLPYKDGQFDAITCFVVLHHIEQLEERIGELYRILAPGGWLLIREHDCRDNATRAIIDIYHNLFELVYNKSPSYSKVLDEYYGDYKTKEQWHFLMQDAGFEKLDNLKYQDIRRDDLLRIYYYIYGKK